MDEAGEGATLVLCAQRAVERHNLENELHFPRNTRAHRLARNVFYLKLNRS